MNKRKKKQQQTNKNNLSGHIFKYFFPPRLLCKHIFPTHNKYCFIEHSALPLWKQEPKVRSKNQKLTSSERVFTEIGVHRKAIQHYNYLFKNIDEVVQFYKICRHSAESVLFATLLNIG